MIDAESVIYILVAGLIALVLKIVWDWLKIRKSGLSTARPCEDENVCSPVTGIREQQIRMDEREKDTQQHLKEGREKFTNMQNDITEIKENVAAIAAVVNDRAKTGRPLLQDF